MKSIQKTKTFDTLLLAHTLKHALTAIKWSLKMIFKGDFGKINEKQKNILEKTIEKNESLISLVNNLLDTAKIKEGNYSYNKSLTSIEDIIESTIECFKEEAKEKGIKIEFKKPEEKTPKIMIDKEMVKLAIQNMFDNAVKYSLPNSEINIFLKSGKKDVEIQIQDSGIGIPEKQKDKLFNKFFRADNAIKIDADGSGIGLFLAKNIIEAHNGKIWFESEENKGTTFYFSLPI